jgi:hypothetical protein
MLEVSTNGVSEKEQLQASDSDEKEELATYLQGEPVRNSFPDIMRTGCIKSSMMDENEISQRIQKLITKITIICLIKKLHEETK